MNKKRRIREAYEFARIIKRILLLLYCAMAIVILPVALTTMTVETFVTAMYITCPIWLMYFVAKGVCLILDALR